METGLEKRSDQELLELARTDSQAFAALYSRYYRHLRAYAASFLKDADLADDVAEETFARLTSRLGWLAVARRPLAPWLFRVAYNLAMDELRRRSHSQTLMEETAVAGTDPDETIQDIQSHVQEIRNAMSALPPFEYACVTLRFMEDRTTAEIARQLGCTPRQVTLALNYAYKALRRTLSDISPDSRSMIER
ncbi:MAG: sigma-70 family RNA polymerase sigma factor [Caldiserica bacterium]|nr:sigma-70 family RNA polymerase sigma factor [Caldisericota bacterium]